MSKRINEDYNETDQKILKTDNDNDSDADSPLQFFDDHVSFNYVHVNNDINFNTIAEISPFSSDKQCNINGSLDYPNDQPKLAALLIKNEDQNRYDSSKVPSDLNSQPAVVLIEDILVEKTTSCCKQEYSEIVDNIENSVVNDFPRTMCLPSTDIDISMDDTNACEVKTEQGVHDVEDSSQIISSNLNSEVELVGKPSLNEDISDRTILTTTPNDMDLDNVNAINTTSDIPIEATELNNDTELKEVNPDPSSPTDIEKPSRRSARLSEARISSAKNELAVNNNHGLRRSVAKVDTPKQDIEKTSRSRGKRKSNCTPDDNPSPVKRRMSQRIEKMDALKQEKIAQNTPKTKKMMSANKTSLPSLGANDPGDWPSIIPNDLKAKLIEHGPLQLENVEFPRDDRSRCFSAGSYTYREPSGQLTRRNWLVYSVVKDAVFCFPCRILATDCHSALAHEGFRNWRKLRDRLNFHNRSAKHIESMEKWATASIENESSGGAVTITDEEALQLVANLKRFAASRENKLYLLTSQLESELKRLSSSQQ